MPFLGGGIVLTDEEALDILQRHYDQVNAGFVEFESFRELGIIRPALPHIYFNDGDFHTVPLTDERGREV